MTHWHPFRQTKHHPKCRLPASTIDSKLVRRLRTNTHRATIIVTCCRENVKLKSWPTPLPEELAFSAANQTLTLKGCSIAAVATSHSRSWCEACTMISFVRGSRISGTNRDDRNQGGTMWKSLLELAVRAENQGLALLTASDYEGTS